MPAWVNEGYGEYAKRLSGEIKLELKEISSNKKLKNAIPAVIVEDEGRRLLDALAQNTHVVALDVRGQSWSTEQLAVQMQGWMGQGQDVSLLVGGPEGLSDSCLRAAQQKWSLSAGTFPHPLVRIILAEQLYRAYTIIKNHPYHRAG